MQLLFHGGAPSDGWLCGNTGFLAFAFVLLRAPEPSRHLLPARLSSRAQVWARELGCQVLITADGRAVCGESRAALSPMPSRTPQRRASHCRRPGPNCPAPSASPRLPHLLCDYRRHDANAGTSYRAAAGVRHRPQASASDRQRLRSDDNVMCITLHASAPRGPDGGRVSFSAGLVVSARHASGRLGAETHVVERRASLTLWANRGADRYRRPGRRDPSSQIRERSRARARRSRLPGDPQERSSTGSSTPGLRATLQRPSLTPWSTVRSTSGSAGRRSPHSLVLPDRQHASDTSAAMAPTEASVQGRRAST